MDRSAKGQHWVQSGEFKTKGACGPITICPPCLATLASVHSRPWQKTVPGHNYMPSFLDYWIPQKLHAHNISQTIGVAIIWPEIILGAEKKTEASKQSKLLHTRHMFFCFVCLRKCSWRFHNYPWHWRWRPEYSECPVNTSCTALDPVFNTQVIFSSTALALHPP